MAKRKKSTEQINEELLNEVAATETTEETETSELDALAEIEAAEAVEMDGAVDDEADPFLPEVTEEDMNELLARPEDGADAAAVDEAVELEGTELDSFEAAEIEETEFIEDERVESIIESILFASDRPVGLGSLKLVFKGTNVRTDKIKRVLDGLAVEYAGGRRGITLEEVPGGWQLRTKIDNMEFMRRTLKTRSFKLSGPALEVLSIVAYKQPVIKHEIDEIRGVESGHLLRALMEKNLVSFGGKSDLPGRPMQYETTRKFLEIFGLRNLKELPTLSQIDELLPEGIGEEEEQKKQTLSEVTDSMSEQIAVGSYSMGEEELNKITDQLEQISTSSDFFEQEKIRQRELRDRDRSQNIRDALAMAEDVPTRDINWLKKYDEALATGTTLVRLEDEAKKARFNAIKNPSTDAGAATGDATADGASLAENLAEADHLETTVVDEAMTAAQAQEEEPGLFEEDAPHPEDELPLEAADIDEDSDLR
ncbi:MAG: SMC-Scp complex subunit ScpB [Bdellovibrionaceae bacterium]|nr:SMC-Scp complex subunit ScpB [Pseudobdellovibrionaceae bacterium]